jgi:hypothetical protein
MRPEQHIGLHAVDHEFLVVFLGQSADDGFVQLPSASASIFSYAYSIPKAHCPFCMTGSVGPIGAPARADGTPMARPMQRLTNVVLGLIQSSLFSFECGVLSVKFEE